MTTHTRKVVNGVEVPLTDAEIAELDARDAAEAAAAPARALAVIRAERNTRLAACDWTQVADAPVDRAAWAAYRQALRDFPETVTDPLNPPPWPEAP